MAVMNLLRKVKIENSWKRLPVKRIGDRYDFTAVLNGGVQTVVTAGTFYLEWREAGERKRRAVGTHPREAKAAIADQARVVALRESGMEIPDAPQIQARRQHAGPSIADVIARFNEIAPMKYAAKSRAKYLNALRDFQRWCNARQKTHVEQIGRHEVIDFMGHVVAKDGLDNSTALDKGRVVHAVFNQQGADIRMKRGDWPRVTETEVEVYEPAVLEKLFAAATVAEYVLFQTFMLTGFREQEIGFLSWDDFKPARRTLSVTEKRKLGFVPKDKEERTVPIPECLVEMLIKHRPTDTKGEDLVFPTSAKQKYRGNAGGQRDRHMLDRLKKLAKRAGLNCGRCEGTRNGEPATCATAPLCKRFGLHKFRHTYATTLLRDGVDLVSLQKLLGHSDLESTRKYLKALAPDDMHAKIAASSLATNVYQRG